MGEMMFTRSVFQLSYFDLFLKRQGIHDEATQR